MDRQYAYLSINGTGTPGAVSAHLGLIPTKAWKIGDPHPRLGAYKHSHWTFEVHVADAEFLDEYIEALLAIIEPKANLLATLPGDFEAHIQCVGYYSKNRPGFHLSADLITRIAALNLDVDFDLYCNGDDRNEG